MNQKTFAPRAQSLSVDAQEQLLHRRRFIEATSRFGFTTAVLGSIGGFLHSATALAQTSADEEKKQKAAKQTMGFATEYKLEDFIKVPIMQTVYKENVERASKGQIYVKLHPPVSWGWALRWHRRFRPARFRAAWCRCRISRHSLRWLI